MILYKEDKADCAFLAFRNWCGSKCMYLCGSVTQKGSTSKCAPQYWDNVLRLQHAVSRFRPAVEMRYALLCGCFMACLLELRVTALVCGTTNRRMKKESVAITPIPIHEGSKMLLRTTLYVMAAIALFLPPASVIAAPGMMNYQALLTDQDDLPLEGDYGISFTIYGSSDGSDILWQEDHGVLSIVGGQLSVTLGNGDPAVPLTSEVFTSDESWIAISVNGQEFTPRSRLVSVPYSQRVSTIDNADGGTLLGGVRIRPPISKSGGEFESGLVITGDASDSVIISPADDIVLKATTDDGVEAFMMETSLTGGNMRVSASDAAKNPYSALRQVSIDPGEEVVLAATELAGDTTIMFTSNDMGGVMRVSASDAAKGAFVSGREVVIDPAQDIVLKATDQEGDTVVLLSTDLTGGAIRVSASDAAKTRDTLIGSVLITPDGIFIFGEMPDDTVMQLLPDGSIIADGQIRTGDSSSNAGEWATALGYNASASGDTSTVSGGSNNVASSFLATVGGGASNVASGHASVISGGQASSASGATATVGGGNSNTAAGDNATVPGGFDCAALGVYSSAIGNRGKANHDGSAVIVANSSSEDDDSVQTGGDEQLVIRADGGIFLTMNGGLATYNPDRMINTPSGAHMTRSGHWNNACDVILKENFTPLNGEELLAKLSQLSIMQWNYILDGASVKHIGPTAQDFREVFGLGSDDKTISTIDPSGIALKLIQTLDIRTRELMGQAAELDRLNREVSELRAIVEELRSSR